MSYQDEDELKHNHAQSLLPCGRGPPGFQYRVTLEIVPKTCPLSLGKVLTFKFFAPLSLNKNILYSSLEKRHSQGYFGNSFASWFQIQQHVKGL